MIPTHVLVPFLVLVGMGASIIEIRTDEPAADKALSSADDQVHSQTNGAADRAEHPAMGPRDVYPNTSLVRDGAAECTIVYPAGEPRYKLSAESLASRMNRLTGARVDLRADAEVVARRFVVAPEYRRTNLILLGNLNNNQAMFYLYGNHFTRVDCEWPGQNGFVVQTIGNPFGTKKNVVIVGGSVPAGVEQAVECFLRQAEQAVNGRSMVLPRVWKVVVEGKDAAAGRPDPTDDYMKFQSLVGSFVDSGSVTALETVKEFLKGQLADNTDLFTLKHYRGIGVAVALDLIDDTGILTSDELAVIDNTYLHNLQRVFEAKQWPFPFGQATGGSDTHSANGALEYYFPATYLLKYGNPNQAARRLLEDSTAEMRVFLDQMVKANHGNYGDTGWTYGLANLCWFRYALHDERYELFDQGYARNQWLLGVALRNHAGTDGVSTLYYNDPRMKYLSHQGSINGWGYTLPAGNWPTPNSLESEKPVKLLGVFHVPLDAAHHRGRDVAVGFDKICFMDDFHRSGYYMLVQGGSADWIRRFRFDTVDLLSADAIVNDGFGVRIRSNVSELLGTGRSDAVAFARTMFPDPTGYADRLTTTVFRRGEYFVVFDRFVAAKPAKVTYMRRWTPKSPPMRIGRSWQAYVDQFTIHLASAEPIRQVESGGMIRQMKTVDAQAGDVTSFQNILYVETSRNPRAYTIVRLNDSTVLVRDNATEGEPVTLIGCNDTGKPVAFGEITTDAAVFYIAADTIQLFDGQHLRIGDQAIALKPSDEAWAGAGNEELGRILAAMYEEAAGPQKPTVALKPDLLEPQEVLEELWLFDAFKKRGSVVGARIDKSDEQYWAFDFGRQIRLAEIEGVHLPETTTAIEASREGFAKDVFTIPIRLSKSLRFGTHHYGWFHAIGVNSARGLDATCRYLRLPANQPLGVQTGLRHADKSVPLTHIGIQFRSHPLIASVGRPWPPWPKMTASQRHWVVDLDGDGQKELLVATDQHELLALSANGRLLWEKEFAQPIVDFCPTDLDGNGRKEILLAHWDYHLYILDHAGKEVSRTDMRSVLGGCETGPYYLSALPITGSKSRLPVVGSWNRIHLPKVGADIRDPQSWLAAVDDSWPKDAGIRENVDLNGNGVADVLMHGWFGPIVVSECRTDAAGQVKFEQIASFSSLAGTYYHCDLLGMPCKPQTNVVLCIGQNGLAAVELTPTAKEGIHSAEIFRLPVNPVSCFDLGDVNGDRFDDIVLGKPDGYVFVVDNSGKVLAYTRAGDQVWAVLLLRVRGGHPVVAVAADDDLTFYDARLNRIARTSLGRITAMDCVPGEEEDDLVVYGARRWVAVRVNLPTATRRTGP